MPAAAMPGGKGSARSHNRAINAGVRAATGSLRGTPRVEVEMMMTMMGQAILPTRNAAISMVSLSICRAMMARTINPKRG